MNRTRVVFLGMLAICLSIVAVSIALQVISDSAALQLFIATTVFSVGIVALDFFGILGGHHGDAGHDFAGHDVSVGHPGSAELSAGHFGTGHGDTGDIGAGHSDVPVVNSVEGSGGAGGPGDGHAAGDHGHGDHLAHDHHGPTPILSVLTYLRLMVYFCLGFGPTGWVDMSTGRGALGSLAIAVPVGLAALFLAQAFFRFQRRDTDSQVTRAELLSEPATVIVPLDDKTMGKVRIRVGLNVTDRYALAAEPGAQFEKGDIVRVIQATEECVYVR